MKRCFLAPIVFLWMLGTSLAAASEAFTAVKAADIARMQAAISGDATRLGELLADDLTYGHSNGRMQTKAEFIAAVASNQMKYEAFDYEETALKETAPGVVTMTGCIRLKVSRAEVRVEFVVRFLAVWRNEAGRWRLQAYQSTRLPDALPSPTEKSP